MASSKGLVVHGARLVWRHRRLVWWIFFVNLALACLAALAPRAMLGATLDHSMASRSLVDGFDLGTLMDLSARAGTPRTGFYGGSVLALVVFFIYMLFLTGGVLAVYRQDRGLTSGEFFEACGAWFWRMVRLMLLSLLPLGIVATLGVGIGSLAGKLADIISSPYPAVWTRGIGGFIVLALGLWVRLWFDVAQVRAVAQNERGMLGNCYRSFRIALRALPVLLWMYFRISLVAWFALLAGTWLWLRIPHARFGLSWLLLEAVLLVQIATRLWLRGSAITWYQRYAEVHPSAAVEFVTPKPAELAEPFSTQP